jgi:hypothetical protein
MVACTVALMLQVCSGFRLCICLFVPPHTLQLLYSCHCRILLCVYCNDIMILLCRKYSILTITSIWPLPGSRFISPMTGTTLYTYSIVTKALSHVILYALQCRHDVTVQEVFMPQYLLGTLGKLDILYTTCNMFSSEMAPIYFIALSPNRDINTRGTETSLKVMLWHSLLNIRLI